MSDSKGKEERRGSADTPIIDLVEEEGIYGSSGKPKDEQNT